MAINKSHLLEFLSTERLEPYLAAAQGNVEFAFTLYEHNQELSEALYTPLQNLEVALRNRLHDLFTREFGRARFTSTLIRRTSQVMAIDKARDVLHRAGKQANPGRVVAELSLGFWTGFFDACYDQLLWHRHLSSIFKGAAKTQALTRKHFSGRLESIRRLRNRIFHHEPILRTHELAKTHHEIRLVLSFLGPDLEA